MGLRKELKRFCNQTSMKGVPRIVRSESRLLRLAWVFFVIILLCICLWQVGTLGKSFFGYPIATTLREKILPAREGLPYFPSVTVCNHNPISSTQHHKYGIPSLEKYRNHVLSQIRSCVNCSEEDHETLKNLTYTLMSPIGYFQYLGIENATIVGHQTEHFIIHCHYSILIGVSLVNVPCDSTVEITQLVYTELFNCYKVSMSVDREYPVHGLTLMLYLENTHHSPIGVKYNPYSTSGKGAGAKIVLSDFSDPFPFPYLDGIDIASGVSSRVGVSLQHKIRLGRPYGECDDSKGNQTSVTEAARCFLKRVFEKCNCIDAQSPFPLSLYDGLPDAPHCQSMRLPLSEVIKNTRCVNSSKMNALIDCFGTNILACSEMKYEGVVSQSTWPRLSEVPSVITYLEEKNIDIHSVLPPIDPNCTNSTDPYCYTEVLNFLHNNFLEMSVVVTDFHYTELREVPKIVLSELCSQVGGILNLWSGITVVLLLELAEFLFRLFCSACFSTEKKISNSETSKPPQPHHHPPVSSCPQQCSVHCPRSITYYCSECRYHCPPPQSGHHCEVVQTRF